MSALGINVPKVSSGRVWGRGNRATPLAAEGGARRQRVIAKR